MNVCSGSLTTLPLPRRFGVVLERAPIVFKSELLYREADLRPSRYGCTAPRKRFAGKEVFLGQRLESSEALANVRAHRFPRRIGR